MIKNIPEDKVKIGMSLEIRCDAGKSSGSWPKWPRYYFEKPK